jgi:hypothetical protein
MRHADLADRFWMLALFIRQPCAELILCGNQDGGAARESDEDHRPVVLHLCVQEKVAGW